MLRVRSVMHDGPADGEVDADDMLESVIARSDGDTTHSYRVLRDGAPAGWLDMADLMRALVPRLAGERPPSPNRRASGRSPRSVAEKPPTDMMGTT